MVKPAGIRLAINIMPGGTYWDRWISTPFGFTSWTHRPLGVQVLNLAYRRASLERDRVLESGVRPAVG